MSYENGTVLKKPQVNGQQIQQRILEELGLRQILDVPTLQGIQDRIAKVSGLSLVTVDVKGVPITEETSFCDYCLARRNTEMGKRTCFFSDAYGGLRASMTNEPYIYQCPAGLTDCAIPIVVNDQYIGAILMGQVKTQDQEPIDDLSLVIKEKLPAEEESKLLELYQKVPVMEMEKLKLTGDLSQFIVKMMVEKQLVKMVQKELEQDNQQLAYENFVKLVEIDALKQSEKQVVKDELKPQMMMSLLNSINNISMIEGASLTNELICMFADTIRYSFQQNREYVPITKELENITRFLDIQKICTNQSFHYAISVDCDIEHKEMLSLVLLPFVENAITHGILARNDQKGHLTIAIRENGEHLEIDITDNGVGMTDKDIKKVMNKDLLVIEPSRQYQGLSIANTRKRLVNHYGDAYDVQITANAQDQGVRVTIRIPLVVA